MRVIRLRKECHIQNQNGENATEQREEQHSKSLHIHLANGLCWTAKKDDVHSLFAEGNLEYYWKNYTA